MKTRQYPDICKTCNGTGRITDCISTTDTSRICPVCNGRGVIVVLETETDDYFEIKSE